MYFIENLTDDPLQKIQFKGIPSVSFTLALRYLPAVKRWTMDVSYGDFAVNGIFLALGLNVLRQYRNLIPFGIMCTATGGLEPYRQDDFLKGRVALIALNSTDVSNLEAQYFT